MSKIQSQLEKSGYPGNKAAFFVNTLQALALTTPKNIADEIVTIKAKDTKNVFFKIKE